jgi:hypothetical protein
LGNPATTPEENAREQKKILRHRISAIISGVIWTIGFFLSFVIPVDSPYIWTPDFLLLTGFFPLMLMWRPIWPWFLFGLLNGFIGMVLETTRWIPDQYFPSDVVTLKHHLSAYHVGLVWILVGAGALFFGALRLIRALIARSKKS